MCEHVSLEMKGYRSGITTHGTNIYSTVDTVAARLNVLRIK